MPESIFDRKVSAAGVFEVKQTEFIYKVSYFPIALIFIDYFF